MTDDSPPSAASTATPATLLSAFSTLHLPPSASSSDIRKSYRALSLRLHPDKARDVPPAEAAARFHALHAAYELLSDEGVRAKLARQAEEQGKRKERVGKFESERRRMAEELERREREGVQRRREERQRREEVERLREQGRRLREQRGREAGVAAARAKDEAAVRVARDKAAGSAATTTTTSTTGTPPLPADAPPLAPLDSTIRILYPANLHPTLSHDDSRFLRSHLAALLHADVLHIRYVKDGSSSNVKERDRQHGNEAGDADAHSSRKRRRKDDGAVDDAETEASALVTLAHPSEAYRAVELGADLRLGDLYRRQSSKQTQTQTQAHSTTSTPTSTREHAASTLDHLWLEWGGAREAARRARRERRARRKAGEGADLAAEGEGQGQGEVEGEGEGEGENECDKSAPPPKTHGEPALVSFLRERQPAVLQAWVRGAASGSGEAEGEATTAARGEDPTPAPAPAPPPRRPTAPAAPLSEADVLRRAMEAARAKRAGAGAGAGGGSSSENGTA